MWVLVKLGGFSKCQCELLAASSSKSKLEEETQRIIKENEFNRIISEEIYELSNRLTSTQPFTLPKPSDPKQIVEWQSFGFWHDNQLKEQARREVLTKYGKTQQDPFDYNLKLDIWETKELK
jgi:hypothetical protein